MSDPTGALARPTPPRLPLAPLSGALLVGAVVLVGAVLLVAPGLAAGWLIVGGAVVALALVEPFAALLLLPGAVAFGSLAALDVKGLHAGPTDVLVAALALALLLALLARLRSPTWDRSGGRATGATLAVGPGRFGAWLRAEWHRTPQLLLVFAALLLYLLVDLASFAVARNRVLTAKEVLKWGEVLAVAGLTLWLVRTPRQVRLVVWALIAAGLAEALIGYAQWALASGDLGAGGGGIRVFGTFAQPNPYGGDLNYALPPALALALYGRDARERWMAGGAAVLLLGAQALALSRGALLGLVGAVVVLLVLGWRGERLAALAALVAVPLVAVAWVAHIIPLRLQDRVLAQFTLNEQTLCGHVNDANFSTMERLAHWGAGLRMFAAHPLLGVGAGNYDAAYSQYRYSCWPESLIHAHNYYINAAAETGILGLLALVALVVVSLYAGWRAVLATRAAAAPPATVPQGSGRTRAEGEAHALALGLLGALVAIVIHNFTDDLFVHAMELQLALCLGCLVRLGMPHASNAR